jgi:hypothetical protein
MPELQRGYDPRAITRSDALDAVVPFELVPDMRVERNASSRPCHEHARRPRAHPDAQALSPNCSRTARVKTNPRWPITAELEVFVEVHEPNFLELIECFSQCRVIR